VVGSQPFGGEGLSGTGPKAGGPHYLSRFLRTDTPVAEEAAAPDDGEAVSLAEVQAAVDGLSNTEWTVRKDRLQVLLAAADGLDADTASAVRRAAAAVEALDVGPLDLPGPTGESNRLWLAPRDLVLCLGQGAKDPASFAYSFAASLGVGCSAVGVSDDESFPYLLQALRQAGAPAAGLRGKIVAEDLTRLRGISAVAARGGAAWLRPIRQALAAREGPIVGLVTDGDPRRFMVERTLCVDTTAAGGNATLLAAAS
jgi:RHH-type proline utilization regulon transcriptional repressor/proline dehydrogenase/delta 1-pyrroline-5-carboxylate dehydrogenase